MSTYAVGQICLNGHPTTGNTSTGRIANYCEDCGQPTINSCPHCKRSIRGDETTDYDIVISMLVPSFCYACGEQFPWTERRIQAAKDLADEIEGIDGAELSRAKDSFIVLVSDTPHTPVAASRITKLLQKASPVIGGGIRDILVSIATDAAKKTLGM